MDEFKFPDELDTNPIDNDSDIQVEIVDDTPEQDRNRKPVSRETLEVTDEEIAQYGGKVQKRIKDLRHGYHDERRAKEEAIREKEEALAHASRLQSIISQGHKTYVDMARTNAETEMEKAKQAVKQAYESGDTDALINAQERFNDVQFKYRQVKEMPDEPALQAGDNGVYSQSPPQQAKPDEKAARWQARNAWFGSDDEMTSFALGVHKKLVESGIDPRSEAYYERIDARVREIFPDYFGVEKPRRQTRNLNVVAPATRSTAPRRVKLTNSQIGVARRLGVTPEQYAKQLVALEANYD
jgi:hypothetical protein